MRAGRGAVALMSIVGLAGCWGDDGNSDGASDDGPSTQTQASCFAFELVVGVVAGRLQINAPQGISDACESAVEAYLARNAVLNVELGTGDVVTLQFPQPQSEPVTTLDPSLVAAVNRILADNAAGG